MSKVLGFFKDKAGEFSSSRLLMVLAFGIFSADWIVSICRGEIFAPSIAVVTLVATLAGLKTIGKFGEK